MRKACEDSAVIRCLEIPEQQRFVGAGVERIRIRKRVRYELELMSSKTPAYPSAQGMLESRERAHHQRVYVLRVKPCVVHELVGLDVLKRVNGGAICVLLVLERLVQCVSRGIEVDHLKSVSPWPRVQFFGRERHACRENETVLIAHSRILRENREVILSADGRSHGCYPCAGLIRSRMLAPNQTPS